jgi:hypothetical protein
MRKKQTKRPRGRIGERDHEEEADKETTRKDRSKRS